jgi:hypothetical protein
MLDKSLLKVSYILGIAFGAIETITIVGALVGIPTIIIALQMKKYYEMSNEEINKKKDTFLLLSVILALISPLCGILALIFYIGLERENEKKIKK